MTDDTTSPVQKAQPSEPLQVNLRAEILQQISVAQSDLEKALSQLAVGDARIPFALQLANLSALRQQVSLASASALPRMQEEIIAAVATAQALTDGSPGNNADSGAVKSLAAATAEARQTAQGFLEDYYDKRKFGKFLEFSSDEDKRAYREREKKLQAEIEKALAGGTPEGAKRALSLEAEQLDDAKAHGADRSPDFQEYSNRLKAETTALENAISTAKPETSQNAAIEANAEALGPNPNYSQAAGTLKNAGVMLADQSQTGHGVTVDASLAALLGRG